MVQSPLRPGVNAALVVLSVLGLLLWTAGVFFGLYFYGGGSLGLSIPVAAGSGALMAFFLFMGRHYTIEAKTDRRSNDDKVRQWVFIALYSILSLCSLIFVLHAVAVATTLKERYQTQTLEDLGGMLNLVDPQGPDGSYAKYVNSEVTRYRQGNAHKDPSTLEFESQQLRQILTEKSGYNNLQKDVSNYWQTADFTVREWKVMSLPATLNTFNERHSQWIDSMQKAGETANTGIYAPSHVAYKPDYQPKSQLYTSINSFGGYDFAGWAIPIALLVQVLIVLSWVALSGGGYNPPTGINDGPTWNPNNYRNNL